MTQFKKGDRVEVVKRGTHDYDVGHIGTITYVDTDTSAQPYILDGRDRDDGYPWLYEREIALAIRDLDHLQVGDVLIDEDDDEATVLAVLGDVFLISRWNTPSAASLWHTVEHAKRKGWTLKDQPAADPVELTLEDVAKLKGVPVSQIKIVEK
ncbi:hypothetical protein G3I13_01820 [Streptomyces sp. SID6673]|nr:hypothetical protein [Streptomyces sp. SID11726]NDZ94898.1 hypothetical protein [Streptomyces sp. SID11726]NEB23058.1 hypothetical protein [Streptomyces sp. SID6673]